MRRLFAQFPNTLPVLLTWPRVNRRALGGAMLVLLIAGAFGAWRIRRQAHEELAATRVRLERQGSVPFEKSACPIINEGTIKLLQNTDRIRSLARFGDSYFAATDGGLIETATDGKFKRHFTVHDGLPESDLTALAVFDARLWIGTRSQGLAVFDGQRFERYRWTDRQTQAVTALLPERGRLLIGTFAGGLLVFDGAHFNELGERRLNGVNHLTSDGARLYVGTFADGLWINEGGEGGEGGRWLQFTTEHGLPSNRIVGVIASADFIVVASDFGLASATASQLFNAQSQPSAKSFRALATLPALAGVADFGGFIWACRDNGELFQVYLDERAGAQAHPLDWPRGGRLADCRLAAVDGSLWLLSNAGLWRAGDAASFNRRTGRLSFARFGSFDGGHAPTGNTISALAVDGDGGLWAGGFRHGIDVFTPEGRRLTHLESEFIREINALVWDANARRMLAATAQGLLRFNASLQPERLGTDDGLLSNVILHVAATDSATATNRGLSFNERGQWRGLTTVQGLPSNSVYAVLPHREFIFAGTLNGLAQIAAGRVVRVFKDSNSKLTHNWVTALCRADSRLFIGTYGGGVFELTAAGELAGFAAEIGRQFVNPNAMFSDGKRLYVGTLEGAWILDLRSQRWSRLKNELPSTTVLSVTGDGKRVYFGTTSGIARLEASYRFGG